MLTDALAVYSVYSQLAPNLELSKLSTLIDSFGSTKDVIGASNSKTLETALDALRIVSFNGEDKNLLDSSVTLSSSNHSFRNINDYFEDVTSGYKISQDELTVNTTCYFFGGEDADNPAASVVEDHLYGGGDLLKGREGDDPSKTVWITTPTLSLPAMASIRFGTPTVKG